jgi:hypothetical protein
VTHAEQLARELGRVLAPFHPEGERVDEQSNAQRGGHVDGKNRFGLIRRTRTGCKAFES